MLTGNAKKVGQAPRPEVSHKQGIPTIDAFFRAQREREQQPPNLAVLPVVATKGTRTAPRFLPSHPEIKKYNEYLRSYDGERKSEREAEAIATDVSKFLRYASEKVDWLHIMNPQKVRSYLEHLEKKAACGVDGCLTKLQRISKALSYITQELYPNDKKIFFRCQQVAERYAKWRRVLQKERTLKSKLRLEKVSDKARPLSQMVALTHHKPLWDNIAQLLLQAATTTLPPNEQRNVVAALVGLIVQKNWQRPGVATCATLEEFEASEKVDEDGPTVMVMRVSRHKTARQGAAHVVMTVQDYELIRKYVRRIRPKQDPSGLHNELFLLPGPKPVQNAAALMQGLGRQYNIDVQTPTSLRKTGATAAISLGRDETTLIQRHMSHAPSTAAKYYQAVTGRKEAAKAHLLRRKLEGKSKEENESETSDVENVESEDKSEASEVESEVGSEETEQHKVEKTRPVKGQMPKKRQPFTDKERKLIHSYFEQDIKTKTTPSLSKCRQFLAKNNMSRTPKQIQDHVRQC